MLYCPLLPMPDGYCPAATYHGGSQAGRVTKNEPHERRIVLSLERLSGRGGVCCEIGHGVEVSRVSLPTARLLGLRFLLRSATHLGRERERKSAGRTREEKKRKRKEKERGRRISTVIKANGRPRDGIKSPNLSKAVLGDEDRRSGIATICGRNSRDFDPSGIQRRRDTPGEKILEGDFEFPNVSRADSRTGKKK